MSWLKLVVLFALVAPVQVRAESEKCDPFTVAAKNGPPPMTILRAGVSPIVSISGQLYHYDPIARCLRSTTASPGGDCAKAQRVMSGGKAVAVIEGQSQIRISPVDARGNVNSSGLYYQLMVEHDSYRTSQPRFWMEAVNPRDEQTGAPRTVGRLDSIEGLTIDQMAVNKSKLASGRKLINMNGSSLMYTNCRKLTVARFDDRFYPAPSGRAPAATLTHLQQPPRPAMVASLSRKK